MVVEFIYGFLAGSVVASFFGLFCLYCVGRALANEDSYALIAEERARAARAARIEAYLEENR